MDTVRGKAYVILDGTLLPIDRIAADRPYYSGKKKHHGMNVQVLADPAGRLIRASDALPGAVHDLTAARTHDIPATLAADTIKCWADKAYQGASPTIRVPFRDKDPRGWRRRHNRDHAKIRSLGERAMAVLKGWRFLRKLRCSTTRITTIVRAVVALELANLSRWKQLDDSGIGLRTGAMPDAYAHHIFPMTPYGVCSDPEASTPTQSPGEVPGAPPPPLQRRIYAGQKGCGGSFP